MWIMSLLARRRFLCLLVSSLFSVRISSFCERLLAVCHLLAFLSAHASFLPQLGSMRLSTANPNRDRRAIEKTGVVELSRREREELERQRRQRIYEPGGGPTAARGGRAPACSERRKPNRLQFSAFKNSKNCVNIATRSRPRV
ncbi:hypothetical protein TGRUB_234310B [Toxoplasma gondii RUB]|uniref:Uncharacterized protein n=1 Tax=Toxoplasma gondii RUB TaxID=935652 RepID=A0A086LN67_TOXGO|nr:hypothetical protein TGRUB_234310B [Toxoplasma gondii RUB]